MEIFVVTLLIPLAFLLNPVDLSGNPPPPPTPPEWPHPAAAPPPTPGGRYEASYFSEDIPTGLYMKVGENRFEPIPEQSNLIEYRNFYYGRTVGQIVFPLYSRDGIEVKQEKHNSANQIKIFREGAARWGIPGPLANVMALLMADYRRRQAEKLAAGNRA